MGYSQQWQYITPMKQARFKHHGIQLRDGRILIVGGRTNTSVLRSCELYDPSTNTWQDAAPLNVPRYRFALTMLDDGRVIAIGGLTNTDIATTNTAEIYDPVTNTWTLTASMVDRREGFPFTKLPGNRILCLGGLDADRHTTLKACEVFNENTLQFEPFPSLPIAVWAGNVNYLPSIDKVIVSGGGEGGVYSNILKTTQIFDLKANQWSLGDSMQINHGDFLNHLKLPNDEIYILGGGVAFKDKPPTDIVEKFDPVTMKWLKVGTLSSPLRWDHYNVLIGTDTILSIGGSLYDAYAAKPIADCNWYEISSNKCYTAPFLQIPRLWSVTVLNSISQNSTCYKEQQVFVFGGLSGSEPTNTAEVLDVGAHSIDQALDLPTTVSLGERSCSNADTTFFIKNNGCDTLQLSSLQINNKEFTVESQVATLPVGDSIPVTIHFHPESLGERSADITFFLKSGKATITKSLTVTGTSTVIDRPVKVFFKEPSDHFIGDTLFIPLYAILDQPETIQDLTLQLSYNSDFMSQLDPIVEGTQLANASLFFVRERENGATLNIPGNFTLSGVNPLLTLRFRTFVTDTGKTTLSLESLSGDQTDPTQCHSLFRKDFIEVNLRNRCGDNTLRSFMKGKALYMSVSTQPNEMIVTVNGKLEGTLQCINLLGEIEKEESISSGQDNVRISSQGIHGPHILRFTSAYGTVSQKILIP